VTPPDVDRRAAMRGTAVLLAFFATGATLMPAEPTNARDLFGDIAPKLAELTDKILFGDMWADDALSPRDRSLVTITTLVALYRHNELGFHLKKGVENGLTREEIVAAITHTAFYAGWPTAMTGINVLRDALKEA
jgi:4-carboxymuconolactone decarboxylase